VLRFIGVAPAATLEQLNQAFHHRPGQDSIANARFDSLRWAPYEPAKPETGENVMKVRNSLKSLRGRHRDNKIVRRKGRVYVINKTQPRFKARQG